MKKLSFLIGVTVVSTAGYYLFSQVNPSAVSPLTSSVLHNVTPTPKVVSVQNTSLFIPYWTLGAKEIDTQNYDQAIYFGVAAAKNGLATEDDGYKNIALFLQNTQSIKEKVLTLRMIDSKVNFSIFDDKNAQKKLLEQTISLAKQKGFSAILLDLEVASLPFNSVIEKISAFVEFASSEVKKNNLPFYLTLYGDTFYRARPFDVPAVTKNADRVYIMAYDFHKARGNPGPNFPYNGKDTYGYDFKSMVDNFSQKIDRKKLVVIFGYFGYDWKVDNKNNSTESLATPISYNEIRQKYLTNCQFKNCIAKRDMLSQETKVTYTDDKGDKHVVWFEDQESIEKKKTYLQEKGIGAVSYWAYSYF